MKLRDLSIGVRFVSGFGTVLALLARIVVTVSVTSLRNRDQLVAGFGGANAKLELSNAMQRALFESAIAIRNIGLHKEVGPMKKEEEKIKVARARYADARDKLENLGLNAEDARKKGDSLRPQFTPADACRLSRIMPITAGNYLEAAL